MLVVKFWPREPQGGEKIGLTGGRGVSDGREGGGGVGWDPPGCGAAAAAWSTWCRQGRGGGGGEEGLVP